MAVIGFHYKKMLVEKKKSISGKINVRNNITLKEVKEAKINLGNSKKKGIEFSFEYVSDYQPDIAKINLTGAVVFLGKEEEVKAALEKWEKEKKLPDAVFEEVYNTILAK